MNILPESYQKTLRDERHTRFALALGTATAVVVVIWIVLLLPSFFFLFFQEKALMAMGTGKDSRFGMVEQLRGEVSAYNNMLTRAHTLAANERPFTAVLADMVARTSSRITYSSLRYSGGTLTIELKGVAKRRTDLIDFVAALEESEYIQNVDSPVENFLKDADTPFTLTISLQPPA